MKKALLVSAIALALFVPRPALADWVEIGSTRNGTMVYVDEDSIVQDGHVVTYQLKVDDGNNRAIASVLADCKTNQLQYQKVVVNGKIIHPYGSSFPLHSVPAGTSDGAAIQYACGGH